MLFNLIGCGEKLSELDIQDVENKISYLLPNDYKLFIMKFNGGVPKKSNIDFCENKLLIPGDDIKRFYGFGVKPTNDFLHKMEVMGDEIPEGFVYIAYTHSSNFFLLSLRDDSFGSVYYKDHETEDFSDFDIKNLPESIIKVSDCFEEFLSRLYEVED